MAKQVSSPPAREFFLLVAAAAFISAAAYEPGTIGHDTEGEIKEAILAELNAQRSDKKQVFQLSDTQEQEAERVMTSLTKTVKNLYGTLCANPKKPAVRFAESLRRDVAFYYRQGVSEQNLNCEPGVVVRMLDAAYGLRSLGRFAKFLSLGPAIFAPTLQHNDKPQPVGISVKKRVLCGDVVIVIAFGEPKIAIDEMPNWIADRIELECEADKGDFCNESQGTDSDTGFLECAKTKFPTFQIATQAVLSAQPSYRGKTVGCGENKMDLRTVIIKRVCPKAKLSGTSKFGTGIKSAKYDSLCFGEDM